MLPSMASVDLSRWQFGLSASYHFLFVPLTLGLSWLLLTMELVFVCTGKQIYKDMTRFWGKLFGINFAVGVLTGLSLEFQFGTNWAYYSQYVGDIFGTPLAIEGFAAFMLESTFLGLFFFGWNKLTKKQHLFATFCLALGSSLSALLILIANGYMQHPVGAEFDFATMRMQTGSLWQLIINPIAQIGFIHTVVGGYVTGSVFVLGISSFYILRGRDLAFAKRSFVIASGFGLISCLMVAYMGDANGLVVAETQPMKLAAIEAEWETHEAPAAFNVIAFPSQSKKKNVMSVQIPGLLGFIVTHSFDAVIPGIKDLQADNEQRIKRGMVAYDLLKQLRSGEEEPSADLIEQFNQYKDDLGYGLLLKQYTEEVVDATPQQIKQAAEKTVPTVSAIFWSFRAMVAAGFSLLILFAFAFVFSLRGSVWKKSKFLKLCLYAIPLPWIACICGWFVTEHGRQPWTIYGVLPTDLSASTLSITDVNLSLITFGVFFTLLLIVELKLMFKYARLGPSSLHTGRYYFERKGQ
jgi:cytochrome bd ubiquinol oxidase subunit I